jgi:peroxiredoxin
MSNELQALLQKIAAEGVKAAPHRLVVLVVMTDHAHFEVGWNQNTVTKDEIANFVLNIHATFCKGAGCPIEKDGECGLRAMKKERDAMVAPEAKA